MEKTSYGTIYKAKLADGGTIALRLMREGSCKDGGLCLPAIKQLGRIRHDNLIPLRAFYQGKRGEKLLIYDYLSNRTLHELLHGKHILTLTNLICLLFRSFMLIILTVTALSMLYLCFIYASLLLHLWLNHISISPFTCFDLILIIY